MQIGNEINSGLSEQMDLCETAAKNNIWLYFVQFQQKLLNSW